MPDGASLNRPSCSPGPLSGRLSPDDVRAVGDELIGELAASPGRELSVLSPRPPELRYTSTSDTRDTIVATTTTRRVDLDQLLSEIPLRMGRRKHRNNAASTSKSLPEKQEVTKDNVTSVSVKKEATASVGPINVYFRLAYPLVLPDIEDDSAFDNHEDFELNFWPRFVFAANLCLVCMEKSTMLCESCCMVSYCSSQHREQAYEKHQDLCEALMEIRLMEERSPEVGELSAEHYRVYRLKLLEALEAEVQRPLELWEKEVILYPRVCRICHKNPENLVCCSVCLMECFCKDHENEHEKWCQEFRVFRTCLFMQHRHGPVDPKIASVRRETPVLLPDNFDALMLEIYGRTPYYCGMDCYTYAMLSHIATVPLTALYGMQIGRADWQTTSNLVIHIIGAEFLFECMNLHVWERLFLHFLPNLKTLSLVFVGPELHLPREVPVTMLARIKLCPACKASGASVRVSFQSGQFYHDFARSGGFVKPDLVCLFNPGLYRNTGFAGRDTWPDTIREFCKTEAPVVVTSYTAVEIPREVERVKSICEIEVLLEPRRNPYASIKPDRNFVSEDVAPLIYKNYYLTVVKGKTQLPEEKALFV